MESMELIQRAGWHSRLSREPSIMVCILFLFGWTIYVSSYSVGTIL